jgi:hypothetical protein
LEIAARFPHSHRRDEAVEKWKANGGLPTFPLHDFSFIYSDWKGGLAADRFPLRSGSFFDENML